MSNNNTNTQETTFWKFLTDNTIEIPIIQRDYAQGRLGKEYLRKSFLADIKDALDKAINKDNEFKMKLDFVYGSVEIGKLSPLDGQQRLTTLWLLHWYIALMSGKLNDKVVYKTLAKFTYETRISSREFCQNLCKPENFTDYGKYESTKGDRKIVEYITSRTWFYSAWKQDPTIQSMLRMLGGTEINNKKGDDIVDGLEELFKCPERCEIKANEKCKLLRDFQSYWNLLISENAPIVFYQLPLKDFGLSDDLYIKMNARGKQLTSFENFKADLVGYIRGEKQKNNETVDYEKEKGTRSYLLSAENGIPIKMDTTWTDIFWKNKSKDYRIDEIYFAFLNRFFLCELICQKKGNDKEYKFSAEDLEKKNSSFSYLYGNKGDDSKTEYKGDFEKYKYYFQDNEKEKIIPKFKTLSNVLDRYLKADFQKYSPKWGESNFQFIPKYKDDNKITTLTQSERVVFHAVSKYLQICEYEEESFKQWMRVVWNIVENANINSIATMIGVMRLIDELGESSHKIYDFLASKDLKIKSDAAEEQVAEEIEKAKKINGNSSWKAKIEEAETFFKGAIRFLFQDAEGSVTEESWGQFDTKWGNAKRIFEKETSCIELAKFCTDEQTLTTWSRFSFEYKNWKPILLNTAICKPTHKYLMGEEKPSPTSLSTDIVNLLQVINTTKVRLLQNWNSCKVVLTNYSAKRSEPYKGWVFEVGNNVRNNLNKSISNIEELEIIPPKAWGEKKYEINGQIYYRGLWTDIKYKEYSFRYYGNTVCLMNDNWESKKLRDPSKADTHDNNFYFSVNENKIEDTFRKKLDCLIQQSIAGGANINCYNNCPNKENNNPQS